MTLNIVKNNFQNLGDLGSELVFTQDVLGNYHSFYWRSNLPELGVITNDSIIKLSPFAKSAYLERIERILTRKIPEQCHCILCYEDHSLPFELIISPIILPSGNAELVLVMGHLLQEQEICLTTTSSLPTNPDPYQKLLTTIARKIRATLNLETIWQQTVDSIGKALSTNRCLLFSPTKEEEYLEIKAEYCDPRYPSILGRRFNFHDYPVIKDVVFERKPKIIVGTLYPSCDALSVLLVPTFYHDQFNGIICLHQCDRLRQWNQAELELVQELADQVGTAIAHAMLYQKLEQANTQAEEASRLKTEFLASTSHELRTPLNGIIGFLRLILDDMTDSREEELEFLDQAYHSALHLLNLINDILDIAKIESGKLEFNLDTISLNNIYNDIYKFAHNQAEKKNLSLNIHLPATYDQILVYADYQRLLQIMFNLVGNSLKFTRVGGIEITTEIIPKTFILKGMTLPGMVKISVADTGIGVSLDKQEKLFETFYQVDGSRTKAYGGTGLGLAISKRLVETMGGKISFYSMGEELGSTVTLTIPLSQMPLLKTD
ncbi:ATP-binding protein [Geminocystis sp. NIES-3709]|uniref:GAF domain-containing sensor histidine kinase n=1 Tax=Geminocystis sp. NIES-3709 TaxID=1617448 RepID=UPI0005FCC75A|nr:ATP-binding protein [Geminocystis sp. NIES-3709]BAQ64159.1 ethylene receptor [Geminocystis sp. NIES-3709]